MLKLDDNQRLKQPVSTDKLNQETVVANYAAEVYCVGLQGCWLLKLDERRAEVGRLLVLL